MHRNIGISLLTRWKNSLSSSKKFKTPFFSTTFSSSDRSQIKGPHGSYESEYNQSISDPANFWYQASKDLVWYKNPTLEQTLTYNQDGPFSRNPSPKWFEGGEINTCYNCIDRHVLDGRGDKTALIYDSPLTNTRRTYTYSQLQKQVSLFASVLYDECNVQKGDRVVIYMPMIPQAIIAMLACARIGAVHSVVFGGFASSELASRIVDCEPKAIISASAGLEPGRVVEYKPLLDRAMEIANETWEKQQKKRFDVPCVIVRRSVIQNGECNWIPSRDMCYDELMSKVQQKNDEGMDAIPLRSTDPHYILYTSGTTGKPKGVLRDTGSHAVALKYSMNKFYNTGPGETFWAASDIGWVVGHSYIVYGPLLQGCATVLYEGKPVGTPDAGAFWRVVQEYNVKTLFTAPTAIRAIQQVDPYAQEFEKYDLSSLKALFLAGERTDPKTLKYCEKALSKENIPVVDHWWQTELGWPAIGNAIGLGNIPIKYGACAAPVPGFSLSVFDDHGSKAPPGQLGNLAIKLPLPPGSLSGLYQNNERYVKEYLEPIKGFYTTGDSALIDKEGYVHIMSRTNDIINTAGHRLSTGAIEEILLGHNEIADCAVIGVKDDLKGHVPVGFVVRTKGAPTTLDKLSKDLVSLVRQELGPVAAFKKVAVVEKLPKTRSGKILRGTMAKIANDEEWTITPTIEDPAIFDTLGPIIKELAE